MAECNLELNPFMHSLQEWYDLEFGIKLILFFPAFLRLALDLSLLSMVEESRIPIENHRLVPSHCQPAYISN